MSQPLVIAHHLIWTAYGWWLPNDPRGSGSNAIRNDLLAELGELHQGRKAVQPPASDMRDFYHRAADLLQHPLATFDNAARRAIGGAFAEVVVAERYTCYACAIMPDHVHVLVRKHKHSAEEMILALKEKSRDDLRAGGHRAPEHPIWTAGQGWKVFLDHPDEVRRTIEYVEKNPTPLGMPTQRWPFVTAYDNWPLHEEHSPNSPYAKRLREQGRYP